MGCMCACGVHRKWNAKRPRALLKTCSSRRSSRTDIQWPLQCMSADPDTRSSRAGCQARQGCASVGMHLGCCRTCWSKRCDRACQQSRCQQAVRSGQTPGVKLPDWQNGRRRLPHLGARLLALVDCVERHQPRLDWRVCGGNTVLLFGWKQLPCPLIDSRCAGLQTCGSSPSPHCHVQGPARERSLAAHSLFACQACSRSRSKM